MCHSLHADIAEALSPFLLEFVVLNTRRKFSANLGLFPTSGIPLVMLFWLGSWAGVVWLFMSSKQIGFLTMSVALMPIEYWPFLVTNALLEAFISRLCQCCYPCWILKMLGLNSSLIRPIAFYNFGSPMCNSILLPPSTSCPSPSTPLGSESMSQIWDWLFGHLV